MQKARERGVKFGNPKLAELNKTRKRKAKKYAWEHKDLLISLCERGMTLQQIADTLNQMHVKTSRGCQYSPMQVSRMLKKIENGLLV